MPNHVTTIIEVDDLGLETLGAVRAAVINDEGHVDFDVIRPSPECLKDFVPNAGVVSRAKMALGLLDRPSENPMAIDHFTANLAFNSAIRDLNEPARAEDIPSISRAISNYGECGHVYWYDWNSENWGTKWNAYGQPKDGHADDATSFEFETAWSHPFDLIAALSAKLPSVRFMVKYADEDTGCNCGWYEIQGGQRQAETIAPRHDDQSLEERRKFRKFAFELVHPNDDPKEYGYDANWDYEDELEDV